MPAPPHIPRATYRLQFNGDFTFADATRIVPYLDALGISHCYASPWLKARPGSEHGYDVIDHGAINPEIGGEADLERWCAALHDRGMGQMLDIVPNHMGIMGADNAWWLDVLENGRAARHAEYFDIDWEPLNEELRGKVLVPVLGEQYGSVLERGELRLAFDMPRGEFSIHYFNHRFPVDPREYPRILELRPNAGEARGRADETVWLEFQALITAFGHLPQRHETAEDRVAERRRDKEVHKRQLSRLCEAEPQIARVIEESVLAFNGDREEPRSFELLHELIKAQAYRLANWRVAADDINYRRFFDTNELAALRMEREEVFEATHARVVDFVAQGKAHALRIDHPDGLYDPQQYFERLQRRCAEVAGAIEEPDAPDVDRRSIYLLIEKIVAGHERLPEHWPVHGTTGYRFANLVNGLFVDSSNESRIDRLYRSFTGQRTGFDDMLYESKKLILRVSLASELNVLANQLSRIAHADRHSCDFTLNGLRDALTDILACFPVYRTYVTARGVSEDDRRFIDWAIGAARKRSQAAETSIFDFVRSVLLLESGAGKSLAYREAALVFAMKFQQLASPVMAKGMEDTTFYRYLRLLSLNEVGGDPRRFGFSVAAFHTASQDRAKNWPNTLLATSTHDSKFSEDVRTRIDVLSEMPAAWRLNLRRWRRMNRRHKRIVDGQLAPCYDDEFRMYQILVGIWPMEQTDEDALAGLRVRVAQYMLKAAREAKLHTSWVNQNTEYENALTDFVNRVLGAAPGRSSSAQFADDFARSHKVFARVGMFNSLSQTLLKLTSPGVPDFYQGSELWDFSLVDPDNRRPVDYARRARLLDELQRAESGTDYKTRMLDMLSSATEGRIKLYLIWKTLALRRSLPDLFTRGDYVPLGVAGEKADHVCAFARRGERLAITIAPRLIGRLLSDDAAAPIGPLIWSDTRVTVPREWDRIVFIDVFTGIRMQPQEHGGQPCIPVQQALSEFPVALLVDAVAI